LRIEFSVHEQYTDKTCRRKGKEIKLSGAKNTSEKTCAAKNYLLSSQMNPPLIFEYALKFPNGKFYNGRVNSEALPDYWQGDKKEAFTFTLAGAYKKKDSLECFSSCIVEKIL
jgi:hypothetical protein